MSRNLWEAYQSIYLTEGTRDTSPEARRKAAEKIAALKRDPEVNPYTKPNVKVPIRKYVDAFMNDPDAGKFDKMNKHVPEYHPKYNKEEVEEILSSYLMSEGYVSELDSAVVLIEHMSDEWVQYVLDEMRKVDQVAGKKSGGNPDPAYREVKKYIRGMEGKPEGQRKKVPGQKPPRAGEYGSERQSPKNIVAIRQRVRAQTKQDQSSRFD